MKKTTSRANAAYQVSDIGLVHFIRTHRKSVAIVVERDGTVSVRAPQHVPQAYLEAFVVQKATWIREKQTEARRRAQALGNPPGGGRRFESGESFLYLGQAYPLQISARQSQPLVFADAFQLSREVQPRARQVFETWYKNQARAWFNERLQTLAAQHRLVYASLHLSSARTRWGSCGPTGTINLNWRLIMAPPAVIDYVILHELAHLCERNHSARYWALVAKMAPDYQAQRQWLKANGERLSWP